MGSRACVKLSEVGPQVVSVVVQQGQVHVASVTQTVGGESETHVVGLPSLAAS